MDSEDDDSDDFKPAAKKPAAKPAPVTKPPEPQFSNPPKVKPVEERASENIRDTVPITKPPPAPPKPAEPEEQEGGERKLTIKELQARMNVAAALSTQNPNSDPNNPLARKRMSEALNRQSAALGNRQSEAIKGVNEDGSMNHF